MVSQDMMLVNDDAKHLHVVYVSQRSVLEYERLQVERVGSIINDQHAIEIWVWSRMMSRWRCVWGSLTGTAMKSSQEGL